MHGHTAADTQLGGVYGISPEEIREKLTKA
jgi:hypothetical protein